MKQRGEIRFGRYRCDGRVETVNKSTEINNPRLGNLDDAEARRIRKRVMGVVPLASVMAT